MVLHSLTRATPPLPHPSPFTHNHTPSIVLHIQVRWRSSEVWLYPGLVSVVSCSGGWGEGQEVRGERVLTMYSSLTRAQPLPPPPLPFTHTRQLTVDKDCDSLSKALAHIEGGVAGGEGVSKIYKYICIYMCIYIYIYIYCR